MPEMDADNWLMGSTAKSAKLKEIGDSVTGFISQPPEMQHRLQYGSNEPMYWEGGRPQMQMRVILMTEEQDDEDDSGERAIYIRDHMKKAVADALKAAGATRLEVGGKLRVKYVDNGEPRKPGFKPPKKYEALYRPPEQPAPQANGSPPAAAESKEELAEQAQRKAEQELADEVPF